MPSVGVVWKVLRTAATNIPWARIVENAPVVVDLVDRVKDRLRGSPPHDVGGQFKLLREENIKLADSLLRTTAQVEELGKALEVMLARQKMMAIGTVVSLAIAISSLVLVMIR